MTQVLIKRYVPYLEDASSKLQAKYDFFMFNTRFEMVNKLKGVLADN
jgi:hypothetical protein